MPNLVASVLLALSLLGCGTAVPSGEPVPSGQPAPSGEPVPLITGDLITGDAVSGGGGCYTFQITTKLVADAQVGTRTSDYIPVKWRSGFTARRVASGEVVVVNPSGMVVATTGHTYTMQGGYEDNYQTTALSVFYACSTVTEVTP